jgi:hypothetical protein
MLKSLGTLVLLAAGIVVGSAVLTAQADKVDVTGAWDIEVQTDAGPGQASMTLKQDGETLTGHYTGQTLGEADLTGTVKGTAIEFSFDASVQGMSIGVKYSGTVENKDAIKGSLSIAGLGNGTFTAKRK